MPEWRTYGLSDFLLFSPRVYWRLIASHNAAFWPLHLLTIAFGLGLATQALRPTPALFRIGAACLGFLWLFVAWAFLWSRYASVNWAIDYAAPAFAAQAALLVAAGLAGASPTSNCDRFRSAASASLLALGLAYPLIGLASGRSAGALEAFGVLPDPTAIATLGLVLALGRPWRLALGVVPALWCVFSGLTLLTMGEPQAWAALGAALIGVAALPRR